MPTLETVTLVIYVYFKQFFMPEDSWIKTFNVKEIKKTTLVLILPLDTYYHLPQ